MAQANKFLEGSILKSLIAMSIPIVGSNILQSMYQFTDAFWVGRLGGTAVAAVSVTFPVTFLLISLGAGFSIAGSTLVAQYMGAKNERMVNHVAAQTLLMVILVSVLLGALGYILAPLLLTWMKVEPAVFVQALGFMRVSFIGIVFIFAFFVFQSLMQGIGKPNVPLKIVGLTVLLNFLLDPLFIFGWGPIPASGVMGAALATLGTQALASVIGLGVLFKGKYGIHLNVNDFKPDLGFIKKAFFLGFPASVEQSARALGITVLTFLIASFGTIVVASYGAAVNILHFVIIPAFGLSMAVAALAGQNIGAGNPDRADGIARLGAKLSFWSMTAFGLFSFIFAKQLIAFFVPGDQAVIEGGALFLRIMSFSFGFLGIQFALSAVFRAAGDMKTAMVLAIVSQWLLEIPIAFLLAKGLGWGAMGIWWSFPITHTLIAIATYILFAKGKWKARRLTEEERFQEGVTETILIDEGVR